ncbi:hypothetical protein C922_04646 [Plasmodium inui San Antonio 1]|uniref:Uncharacterized protein n=1 Tax=Plasmodium inui San Antonio 1 TaxID=1237626 RepID=W7A144_9APIC|nr:hypothetical protein C922_04646 [Plasmodium inui San Antonio 1]EUD65018.1 hypothetical protein C922_04646 [Plasmodium inui San Antonio 1]
MKTDKFALLTPKKFPHLYFRSNFNMHKFGQYFQMSRINILVVFSLKEHHHVAVAVGEATRTEYAKKADPYDTTFLTVRAQNEKMKAPPEIDLLPPKSGIEQGNHPPCLKKKNSKIISYLKNESQINVLLSELKERNGVNFLKNNQCGKFSLNQDKKKEQVTLCNHLSDLSYPQPSEKGINEKKGEIYMHRKCTNQRDNTSMASPPGKKKRTEKCTLLHRLGTLTLGEATEKVEAHVNSHAEVKKNGTLPVGKKIITHEYQICKMRAKKYSTLKYNIFVKGLKNVDNETEGRNTSFPRDEPIMISNNVNSKKSQHVESNAKFNCDDLLQIYEHRYLRHIFKNSKNVPSHKGIKTINNAAYVQGQNPCNSGEHQLSNGTKDNNLDKSEAGINHFHSRNGIHNRSDGKYPKNTVLKSNLNEELSTPEDFTHSRYSSCDANGVNKCNVKSNTADDAVSQVGGALVKGDNVTTLTEQNRHFYSRQIKDPHGNDNLGGEKIPNDGKSDSREMGNSWGHNKENENKNNPNYSKVRKHSYTDASQIELLQNGIHKKIETLGSVKCAREESLVTPLTRNEPEQSGNSWEEEDNTKGLLPNRMQAKKKPGERIPNGPNATEKLIKNMLIKELKNEIYYSIIKMEEDEEDEEHKEDEENKEDEGLIVSNIPVDWTKLDITWFFREYFYKLAIDRKIEFPLIEQVYLIKNEPSAILACHDSVSRETIQNLSNCTLRSVKDKKKIMLNIQPYYKEEEVTDREKGKEKNREGKTEIRREEYRENNREGKEDKNDDARGEEKANGKHTHGEKEGTEQGRRNGEKEMPSDDEGKKINRMRMRSATPPRSKRKKE